MCFINAGSLPSFLPGFSYGGPLHALPYRTVFDILSEWHNKLCHFILDIMDHFLNGNDQPQNNQPNGQAGG